MSNLARKLQQTQQQQQQKPYQAPKKAIEKKGWLTPGEKILGLLFCGAICFGAVHLISNQSAIYETNKSIQVAKANIETQTKVNSDLETQVSELSTYERIWAKAKELGLNLNENNVKVVQD